MNAVAHPIRSSTDSRSIGPDAVRAFAALLVVYLHASVPYLVHSMPGLVWSVQDSPSYICDSLFWAIEVFIMPLFLVISGFYGYRALASADGLVFLKSRAHRLLRPLLFGMVVLLPIILYVWMIGLVADGLMPATKLRSLKVPSPYGDQLWGLSHLWFLLYVFTYAAILAAVNHVFRSAVPMRLRPVTRQVLSVTIPMLGVLTLVFSPEVVFGFQHAFLPVFAKWFYSGIYFAGGVAIANFDPKLRTIDRLAGRHFVLGTIATVAAVLLGCWTLRYQSDGSRAASTAGLVSITLAMTTVLAAWGVTLGMIGMANRWSEWLERRERICRVIQYFAGASFWIYLVHHPIVGLMHIDLKWLAPSLLPVVKSFLAATVAVAFALVSYEWMVRTTGFGRLIGLTSPKKSAVAGQASGQDSEKQRRATRIAA